MAESSNTLHEQGLSPQVLDRHRAIVSLMEELEAADWYAQRAEAATDPELRAILEHNGNEEKEHAAMVLEWLRRHDAGFDRHLRTYLFSEGSITAAEGNEKSAATSSSKPVAGSGKSLGIGSLKVK
jgi:ferritin-like protein